MRIIAALLLLVLASISVADSATQTGWSGGPGIEGPVTIWEYDFFSEVAIDWLYPYTQISLLHTAQCIIGDAACALCPADLDGDGDLDMAVVDNQEETASWWENANGEGTVWTVRSVSGFFDNARGITCADFDSDGDIDIAVSGWDLYWFENSSGGDSWIPHLIEDSVSFFRYIDTADFDGDGDADLAGYDPADDEIVWLENTGPASEWVRHIIDPAFPEGYAVICADVDGDGSADVIAAAPNKDAIAWWENHSGGATWEMHWIDTDFDDAYNMAAGDMDNDGDLDIVCCSRGSLSPGLSADHLSWWSNEGGAGLSWTRHQINTDIFGAWTYLIAVGDYDGDGDLDVLEPNNIDDEVLWWSNLDGSGTAWGKNELTDDILNPFGAAGADVDSDGVPEMFVSGEYYESMMWNADEYQPSGELVSSIIFVNDPDWLGISWIADTPIGTAVTFQVRASDDYTQMGGWSDTLTAPCSLGGILEDYDSFLQYRAILSRSASNVDPVLEEVTFTWNSLGVEGGEAPEAVELRIGCNPSPGSPSIEFGLPASGAVSLTVFDLAGRVVASVEPSDCEAGWHTESLGELAPGVYFVRLTAGEAEASERFVVIE